jgi:phytol kinase
MLQNNFIATICTFALALAWLRLMDFIAHKGLISGKLSRKIIHIGTGPIFVLCWLLFDQQYSGRFLAALVPLATTIQFFLVGTGVMKDDAAVQAMTRTGDRREILRGPLIYGIMFVALTIIFWKDSAIGIVALMVLCGGDGFADIIGKRIKSDQIPWSKLKTVAGSIAMLLGSFILSWLVIYVFHMVGNLQVVWSRFIPSLFVICVISTLVESIPLKDYDNLTVTMTAVLLGLILL